MSAIARLCLPEILSLLLATFYFLKCALVAEAFLPSSRGGSLSLLRKPRLVLRHSANDVGAVLDFFNEDTLGISGELVDAVNCSVSGGHLSEDNGNLQRVTSVSIKGIPGTETWQAPKHMGLGSSDVLQTRTSFNIFFDVEGNLTCRDTLGEGLISNTLLLRFRNRETLIVKLKGSSHYNESHNLKVLTQVHKLYSIATYSKQEGRLLELNHFPEPEAVLRVSYFSESGIFDQKKLYADVNEVTRFIAKQGKLKIVYVRSTRYCLPVEEGNFTWPMTSAGSTAIPENPCMDASEKPQPLRACIGNFFQGVYWDKLPNRPHVCLDSAERSTRILNLTKKLIRDDMLQSLYEEISGEAPLSPVEIYFAAETLRKTSEKISLSANDISTPNVSTVAKVMSAILRSNKSVIKAADDSYGSSQIILESMLQLIMRAASPMPAPVSSQYFSAFASEAGTGIQGFAYFAKASNHQSGKLVTYFRNTTSKVVARRPSLLTYIFNQSVDYSIISTLFEDDSLFSAAEYPGMKIEGPVFGIKLFKKAGEDLKEIQPIPILVRFQRRNNATLQCVSWEITKAGGWSSNGCAKYFESKLYTLCVCVVITSLDMFFTIVRNESKAETNAQLLRLLPLKNNNGALLSLFRASINESQIQVADAVISCSVTWGNMDSNFSSTLDSNQRPKVEWIATTKYGFGQKIAFYLISYSGEGYLHCKDNLELGLISNENLLSKPNSASVIFSGQEFNSKMRNVNEFFEMKYADFNFSNIFVGDINGGVIIRITQISEKNHSDFINSLVDFSTNLALTYKLPLPEVRSNRLCLQHEDDGFFWPTIKLNHKATPINPCIDSSGAPSPVRECIGDFTSGVYWDKKPKRPDPCEQPSMRAQRLHNLTSTVVEKDIFQELLESIKDDVNITVVEANHFRRALKNLAEEISKPNSEIPKPNLTSVVNVVNAFIDVENKMKMKTEELQEGAQYDTLLVTIDKLLEEASTPTAMPVITPHFSAAAVSQGTLIKGFMSAGYEILSVTENETISDALTFTPEVGAVLVSAPERVGITYSTFKDDFLFTSAHKTEGKQLASQIIGLNVFGNEEEESTRNLLAYVFFSHEPSGINRDCHFWDVESSEWSQEGCVRVPSCDVPAWVPENVDACLCTHLTHFAMLVSERDEFLSEDYLLHLITIIGCSISLISLIGIFCIGILFPQWSHGASRKVQLNLSASLTLMMAVYLAIAFQGECPYSIGLCIALGAILHYSILASFSWMLVVAILQLMRLTRSIALSARNHAGTHLVLRASVLGWGAPALPVVITLMAGTDLYVRRPNSSLCYPSGKSFYVSILFPVALIVTINTIIFIWLIRSLFCSKIQGVRVHQGDQRRRALRRFYAAMFLFCLLGISWISGIAIELVSVSETAVKFLSYLFCITASLQGTSLFIFFVACERRVGEKVSRAASIFCRKKSGSGTKIHYKAKIDSCSSDRTNESGIFFTSQGSIRKTIS